jgi:hypothetical protein
VQKARTRQVITAADAAHARERAFSALDPRGLFLLRQTRRDFVEGFRALRSAGPCVTVFGSARIPESHHYYDIGRELGRALGRSGFTVMTGGGPGLMEATNRGARDVGGRSLGCNIRLPIEQAPNAYVDSTVTCHHFFVRKVLLFRCSHAFVALPGGLGTLDELFEVLTLIQTRKVEPFPVVLIGSAFWRPLLHVLDEMASHATIDAADLTLFRVSDDLDDAVGYLRAEVSTRFGLLPRP